MPDTAPPADGAAITSSYLQTMVREQVVRTVTSSTRPTGVEGAHIVETDTERVLAYDGTGWESPGRMLQLRLWAHFRDEKASGTAAGTSTGAAWGARVLNTTLFNNIPSCTLTANVISLPAGTYYVRGSQPLRGTFAAKSRLRDTTTPATLLVGANCQSDNTNAEARCPINGQFTITGTKNVEFQYWAATGVATLGLGSAGTTGEVEVYAEFEIFRVGT